MITNEEYEQAYQNTDNIKLIKYVMGRFSERLNIDEMRESGQIALWKSLRRHDDKYGQKFTTTLYRYLWWEALKTLQDKSKPTVQYGYSGEPVVQDAYVASDLKDILECLSDVDRQMLIDRYIGLYTLEELGEKYGMKRESTRLKVIATLNKLRQTVYN